MEHKKFEITDEEKKLVAGFLKQEALVAAVKKVMFQSISRQINIEDPLNHWVYTIDRTKSDEDYAQMIKIVAQSQSECYSAFMNLEDAVLEKAPAVEEQENEAR